MSAESKVSKNYPTKLILARNTIFNFIGQAIPLIAGIITLPFIIKGLGTQRFGLLSLALVILGYFAVFDLGLGRATTKFVAESVGKGEKEKISIIVWTSVTIQFIFGMIGTFIFLAMVPVLATKLLNIPPELQTEAKSTFYMLAFTLPILLISSSFRGVLEAFQRFDLVNIITIPSNSMTFILPLIGIHLGLSLPWIVGLILVTHVMTLLTYLFFCIHLVPSLKQYSYSIELFKHLFSFGFWIMISNIVGPILVYLDRFLIGVFSSLSQVAYYTAPYEAITRIWIIPFSLVSTLFPTFSSLSAIKDIEKIKSLFFRSIKYLLIILGPIIIFIIVFAQELLMVWLGKDFAENSKEVVRILAFGVLINSLAHIPYALLQSSGRPNLTAKFHIIELPIYFFLALILVSKWGINGAATVWTLRVILDTALLYGATFKIYKFSFNLFSSYKITKTLYTLLIFGSLLYTIKILSFLLHFIILLVSFIICLLIFLWFIWSKVLDQSEKEIILGGLRL